MGDRQAHGVFHVPRQGSVDFAVADIGSVAAFEKLDGRALFAFDVLEDLDGLRRRGAATALLLFREKCERSLLRNGQEVVLGREAARVRAALDVGPVPTVEGQDLDAVLVVAKVPRQGRQGDRRLKGDVRDSHALEERDHLRLLLLVVGLLTELHIGPVAAGLDVNREVVVGVHAEGLIALRLRGQEFLREGDRDLVGRGLIRNGSRRFAALDEGSVATDPHDHVLVVFALPDGDRANGARIDVLDVLVEHRLQTGMRPEPFCIELLEIGEHLVVTAGDRVETALHRRRKAGIDEVTHVLLHERHHRERGEGRHKGRALLEGVVPAQDRVDDRRVGTRPADALFLEGFHERRLRQARRRGRVVLLGLDALGGHVVALRHGGQDRLLVAERRVRIVRSFHVGPQETREVDHAAVRLEDGFDGALLVAHLERHAAAFRVFHLAGDRALPDQLVNLGFVLAEDLLDLVHRRDRLACRADRLVGLLGVGGLALVEARLVGQELRAVEVGYRGARQVDGLGRQRHRVGTHVGDETVLVEALGGAHRALGVKAELAVAFLLERRRGEGRRWRASERPLFGGENVERSVSEPLLEISCGL